MALDLILVDNRLNGQLMLCRSDSLVLSCMLRKVHLCTRERTLCFYGDVINALNQSNSEEIHLRTFERMSLSSDEFIEIIGEIYDSSSDTIDTMKYYIEARDIIDTDTNLILPSNITSRHVDDSIKYVHREDAIRHLLKLIFDRKRDNEQDMINNERIQLKLELPTKFNQLYQPIKKLNHLSMGRRQHCTDRSISLQCRRVKSCQPFVGRTWHN
jgi:hypothetical protein